MIREDCAETGKIIFSKGPDHNFLFHNWWHPQNLLELCCLSISTKKNCSRFVDTRAVGLQQDFKQNTSYSLICFFVSIVIDFFPVNF